VRPYPYFCKIGRLRLVVEKVGYVIAFGDGNYEIFKKAPVMLKRSKNVKGFP
jgi:hypothetical protein